MTALDRFAALACAAPVPLAEACSEAAAHLGSDAGAGDVRGHLDALAAGVARPAGGPTLDHVALHLFGTEGFGGDRADYDAPANSLLPEVLRRRRGLPILLSIVVIEVAARVGVTATGVGMPGHFLVGDGPEPRRWLDPFDGGRWLDEADARARFQALHGPGASFDRSFLEPTPEPQVLARVLANAANSYRRRGDVSHLVRVLELRRAVPAVGRVPRAEVELADAYRMVGRVADAIAVLESLADRLDPHRRGALEGQIRTLAARLN